VTFPDSILVRDVLFLNCDAPSGHTQAELEAQGCEFVGSIASPDLTIIDDEILVNVTALAAPDTITVMQIVDLVNPVPAVGTSEVDTEYAPWETDGFFTYAPYKGAFEPGAEPWTKKWTAVARWGADAAANGCPTDINGDGVTNFQDLQQLGNSYGDSCE
jgi:hypothetical protein